MGISMVFEAAKKKSVWFWISQILKYGAGIVVAVISVYAARQEKAYEADKKANETILVLQSSHNEIAKKIDQLQKYAKNFEEAKEEAASKCKSEVDTIRSNMTFFLMGESKSRTNRLVAVKQQKEILSELLKRAASDQKKAGKPQMKPSLQKFQKPRRFKQIQKQVQNQDQVQDDV